MISLFAGLLPNPDMTLSMRCTVKTDTTDVQSVDSECSKAIHQEMQEGCKTQEAHDERVEKRSCEIELRGPHLKLPVRSEV